MPGSYVRGGVPKRPTGADCKSAGLRLRRFESYPLHHLSSGCSSMVEPQPSTLMVWVRLPSPAPSAAGAEAGGGQDRIDGPGSTGLAGRAFGEDQLRAHVAQSVEHVLGKDEVTGSIPVVGSSSKGLPARPKRTI